MDRTIEYITDNIDGLRGHYICVSNVHTTVMSYNDAEYRDIQNNAVLNLPDGKPLSITQRKRGHSDARRVAGPDLMPKLFKLSEAKGYRHYFYGAGQETLDKLKQKLKKEYPHLMIAGMYSPPFRPLTEEEDEADIQRINTAKPDFIWVGLGAPKQEKWMRSHENKLSGVMVGVGAAFDFHAGTVKRAPSWMQELCLEWLYRLVQDPVRLIPRYAKTNGSYVVNVYRETTRLKYNKKRCEKRRQSRIKIQSRLSEKASLKIAMIGHKRIPSREGGIEIVVDELSRRMVELGHKVDAYNRRGAHGSGRKFIADIGKNYKGIRIITIPTLETKSLNAIVYAFFASIRVLFTKYDVMHYHAEGPCAMLWLPKLFGKHIVVTIHGLDWQRSKWGGLATRVLKFGEGCAARYADDIIVLSKNMQEYFKETYGRETIFIPNGINRPELLEASEINVNYGVKKDEYILFLARIVPEKGAHYLIEAYEELYRENLALTRKKLIIAGGSSHSEDYYKKLQNKAKDNENIIFTDFVGGRRLEELYSNAYIFVLPSDVEGMAISLLEAMSYGNCCLVSDISENTEVIGDKAVIFTHSDINSLKGELLKLISNPEITESYKNGAADYICEKFDWDKVVGKTISVYKDENSYSK